MLAYDNALICRKEHNSKILKHNVTVLLHLRGAMWQCLYFDGFVFQNINNWTMITCSEETSVDYVLLKVHPISRKYQCNHNYHL